MMIKQKTITVDPDQAADKLLSVKQVAERWGCCTHTVRRNQFLKPVRFSRKLIRYKLSDVLKIEQEGS